jgi:nitrate reductase delta subunit
VTPSNEVLWLLSDVLAYPGPGLAVTAAECAAELAAGHPEAAARMAGFAAWARSAGRDAIEEAYTAAFDLAPVASPYVGDQLFGASRERSFLLSGLRELRREAGLPATVELADHVSEVLRLAAAPVPADVREDLLADGLAPALAKMQAALEQARHPWAGAIAAAALTIGPRAGVPAAAAAEALP